MKSLLVFSCEFAATDRLQERLLMFVMKGAFLLLLIPGVLMVVTSPKRSYESKIDQDLSGHLFHINMSTMEDIYRANTHGYEPEIRNRFYTRAFRGHYPDFHSMNRGWDHKHAQLRRTTELVPEYVYAPYNLSLFTYNQHYDFDVGNPAYAIRFCMDRNKRLFTPGLDHFHFYNYRGSTENIFYEGVDIHPYEYMEPWMEKSIKSGYPVAFPTNMQLSCDEAEDFYYDQRLRFLMTVSLLSTRRFCQFVNSYGMSFDISDSPGTKRDDDFFKTLSVLTSIKSWANADDVEIEHKRPNKYFNGAHKVYFCYYMLGYQIYTPGSSNRAFFYYSGFVCVDGPPPYFESTTGVNQGKFHLHFPYNVHHMCYPHFPRVDFESFWSVKKKMFFDHNYHSSNRSIGDFLTDH